MRGEVAEVVAVTAPGPLVQRERSTVQQRISEELVHSLPLAGRDFSASPAWPPVSPAIRNYPSPQGQIFWSNNVLVDGASHFSKWRSAARTFYSGYSLESIKEVQVLTSQFSAEFGEALATVTSAVTNSGSNELRGSGFLFIQDDGLNDIPAFTERETGIFGTAIRRIARRTARQRSNAFLYELRGLALPRQQHCRRPAARPRPPCRMTKIGICSSCAWIVGPAAASCGRCITAGNGSTGTTNRADCPLPGTGTFVAGNDVPHALRRTGRPSLSNRLVNSLARTVPQGIQTSGTISIRLFTSRAREYSNRGAA